MGAVCKLSSNVSIGPKTICAAKLSVTFFVFSVAEMGHTALGLHTGPKRWMETAIVFI